MLQPQSEKTSSHPKRCLAREQRRSLELLASDPHGVTNDRLVIAHGFETKMLAGLVHEGLATAIVGEGVVTGGETVEVVRIMITDAGRGAIAR